MQVLQGRPSVYLCQLFPNPKPFWDSEKQLRVFLVHFPLPSKNILVQESADSFCKGSIANILDFVDQVVSVLSI